MEQQLTHRPTEGCLVCFRLRRRAVWKFFLACISCVSSVRRCRSFRKGGPPCLLGRWILGPGSWVLDSGFWILDPGSRGPACAEPHTPPEYPSLADPSGLQRICSHYERPRGQQQY